MFPVQRAATILASLCVFYAMPVTAQVADLSVRVGAFDGGASPQLSIGGSGLFGVTVTNTGPGTASNVQVNAVLPTGTKFVRDPDAPDGGRPRCDNPDGGGLPCTIRDGLASGANAKFTFKLSWPAPDVLPAVCPTNLSLAATVSATETDPNPANNTSTLADVTVPLADVTGTASGPATPLSDGGQPTDLLLPGATATYQGTVTNNGPCAVPADSLNLDTSPGAGLEFVSGAGDCTPWMDGACVLSTVLPVGKTITFTASEKVLELTGGAVIPDGGTAKTGKESIIQSAVVFNYNIEYGGNPGIRAGDNLSPATTSLVKGPANASSCSAVGGEGLAALPLLLSGLALWLRRRSSR